MYLQNVASITIKIGTCRFKTSSFTFLFSYSKRRANIYPLTSFLLKSIKVIFICSQYEAHNKLLTRGSTYGLCMFSFIFWPDNGRHLRKREYVLRVMRCDLPYQWTVVWVLWQSPPTLGCGGARFSLYRQSQTKLLSSIKLS